MDYDYTAIVINPVCALNSNAQVSPVKIVVASVIFIATFAYCEWFATIVPHAHWAYGFSVNFVFLAVATAVMSALELPLVPHFARRFENNGQIYRWTGIQFFVRYLRLIGWEKFWRKSIPVKHDVEALRKYSDSTRGAEAIHIVAAICVGALAVSVAIRYSFISTKWLWFFNAVINMYPVMLQRYNRPRVERVIRRLERDSILNGMTPSVAKSGDDR